MDKNIKKEAMRVCRNRIVCIGCPYHVIISGVSPCYFKWEKTVKRCEVCYKQIDVTHSRKDERKFCGAACRAKKHYRTKHGLPIGNWEQNKNG